MTTLTLIEQLKPGELLVSCTDGSFLRTVAHALDHVTMQEPSGGRGSSKLLRELIALKQRRKR